MGGRPFLSEGSAFPSTPVAVPSPPSGAVLWSMQEHSRLGREPISWSPVSPLQAPGQPSSFQSVITKTAATPVAFETTWQHTSLDLHKGGKNSQNQWGFKGRCDTKERGDFFFFFSFDNYKKYHWKGDFTEFKKPAMKSKLAFSLFKAI